MAPKMQVNNYTKFIFDMHYHIFASIDQNPRDSPT